MYLIFFRRKKKGGLGQLTKKLDAAPRQREQTSSTWRSWKTTKAELQDKLAEELHGMLVQVRRRMKTNHVVKTPTENDLMSWTEHAAANKTNAARICCLISPGRKGHECGCFTVQEILCWNESVAPKVPSQFSMSASVSCTPSRPRPSWQRPPCTNTQALRAQAMAADHQGFNVTIYPAAVGPMSASPPPLRLGVRPRVNVASGSKGTLSKCRQRSCHRQSS